MAKKRNRKSQDIPENETADKRFDRVVSPRVNKAVKAIEVIGFCAGSTYESTPDKVGQILNALNDACKKLQKVFAGETTGGGGFSLK